MVDPRTSIINQRLKKIRRIIAVSSGKGGVGKSLVATTLALTLAHKGYKTGLFDIDFTSPSTHVILGAENITPKEDKGLVPPAISGLEYMSLIYFTRDHAAPLRGEDTSNALIELLSVTRWSELDFLVIDMPPGIGDAVLDLVRFVKNIEFIIITTPSQLAFETVKKLANLLQELQIPVLGVIENMKMNPSDNVERETEKLGIPFLGAILYDSSVEQAIGNVQKLLDTAIVHRNKEITSNNRL